MMMRKRRKKKVDKIKAHQELLRKEKLGKQLTIQRGDTR
jgi:hypothetical protein